MFPSLGAGFSPQQRSQAVAFAGRRIDPQKIHFVHPQMTREICLALGIPALEGAVRETIDTSRPLVQCSTIDVSHHLINALYCIPNGNCQGDLRIWGFE